MVFKNGFYFNETLAKEYVKHGVALIRTSAYTPDEKIRLENIKVSVPFKVTPIILDDRMKIYEDKESGCNKPCLAPLNEVLITCEGKVSLCCYDWKRQHLYGDLNSQGLDEILAGKEIREAYENLSKGNRIYDICKRCASSR